MADIFSVEEAREASRLLTAFATLDAAAVDVTTALPTQLSARVETLDDERRTFRSVLHDFLRAHPRSELVCPVCRHPPDPDCHFPGCTDGRFLVFRRVE